ncbi:MAG: hypothetical protein ACI4JZ_01090 [Oscillospiraceae bacterium]
MNRPRFLVEPDFDFADGTGFVGTPCGLMRVASGFLRNPSNFGGVEPPKLRGFLHAQTVRAKEPAC